MSVIRVEMSDMHIEMADGFAGVAEAITPMIENIDRHDLWLTNLKIQLS